MPRGNVEFTKSSRIYLPFASVYRSYRARFSHQPFQFPSFAALRRQTLTRDDKLQRTDRGKEDATASYRITFINYGTQTSRMKLAERASSRRSLS